MGELWRVELLAGLRLRRDAQVLSRFRTQKTAALFAYLAYHRNRTHPREELIDRFWPDDDFDAGRRKFNVALSALRQQLEPPGVPDGAVLTADRTFVGLQPEAVSTDVAEFERLLDQAAPGPGAEGRLQQAVELYRGPLLGGFDDDWIRPERHRLAERLVQALGRLSASCREAGDLARALDWARRMVNAERYREESHADLIRLLLEADQPAAALQQYRELERILAEELGRPPLATTAALVREIRSGTERDARPRRAVPPAVPTPRPRRPDLEPVGGAVPLGSRFYVVRETDAQFAAALDRRDSIVLVKGARQVGKTSLLARGLEQARQAGARVALTDLQLLNAEHLESADGCLRALAESLAEELDLEVTPADDWDPRRGPSPSFRRYLRRHVLHPDGEPLVWGLDEVDRLFTCPFGSEVFGLFRALHNERALNPGGPWSRLTLTIAYATEAHLFISDLNQSPFNVGTRLELEDFSLGQVTELNRRYGGPLHGPEEVHRLHHLVGGHPYLVRRALHELATGGTTLAQFEAHAEHEEGLYGDHLRRLRLQLARDAELADAVRTLLTGSEPAVSPAAFYRLRSAGLLTGDSYEDARFRCRLYSRYLRRHLGRA